MSCQHAMITDVVTLTRDVKVEDALALLNKERIRAAPVLDEEGHLLGMFSFKHVLIHLLPISATMEDGLQRLDFVIGSAPNVAKKLKKINPQSVVTVMDENVVVTHPETPIWEAIRLLVRYGSPIPVVKASGKFMGIMTEQGALEELKKSDKELKAEAKTDVKGRKKK